MIRDIICILLCRYRYYGQVIDNSYGRGEGAIFLDEVGCTGSESSLAECSHNGWNIHNCDHDQDVAIKCAVPMTTDIGMFIQYMYRLSSNNVHLHVGL